MLGHELSLAEMISDPIVQQVMRSDGVTTEELTLVIKTARHKHCSPFDASADGNAFSSKKL